MKKLKKVIAVISCLCMVLSLNVSAFASENGFLTSTTNEETIAIEAINAQFEETMRLVYAQLADQNALDLYPVYESIVRAQFYSQIDDNSVLPLGDEDEVYRYAPHGGAATYQVPREFGAVPLDTGMLCLDSDKSYDYILSMLAGDTYNANDIIAEILGLTSLGPGMAVFDVIGRITQTSVFRSIQECDGCAMIITTKNYIDGSSTSVLYGWSSRFWMQPPTNALNLSYTIFTS